VLWYREFGLTEIILIAVFVVLYVLYIIRIAGVAKKLNTPFTNVMIKLMIRTLMFGLFIVALLGPSFGNSKREIKSVGKDIMICVDLSKSMDAIDIQPTRLEKVKYEMKKIVDAFTSDRVGVIIFSSEAFMQCPLTYDQNALNLFIETMNSSLVPASGTDFGPPLKMALDKLEDDDSHNGKTKSKVIILISDGEDFGEETNDIAKDVEERNIKLFTLGVGTEKGGTIYSGKELKRDRKGIIVTSKLNGASLRSLADKTGGQYFEVNATQNDVSRLINTIGRIEGEMRDARFIDASANRYFYFLGFAILLLIIDILTAVPVIKI
jgi:Ca-activated chloride channel family protein